MTQTFIGTLVVESCCNCGVSFGITRDTYNRRSEDHKDFYCPNGHPQHYIGKTDKEKLEEEVRSLTNRNLALERNRDSLNEQIQGIKYSLRATRAAKTKILNRVKNGVCPCCNRTFKDLQSHFKTKHPDLLEK